MTHTKVDVRETPQVSPDERSVTQIIHRIRKLHWIGMDDEAEQLERKLHLLKPSAIVSPLRMETD
jgi:hypothetical protein